MQSPATEGKGGVDFPECQRYEASMIDLLKMTAEHAANYAQGINDRSVFPSAEAIARLDELNERLPDGPSDPADVVSLLDEICSPATVATTGARCYGFVTGGVLPRGLSGLE